MKPEIRGNLEGGLFTGLAMLILSIITIWLLSNGFMYYDATMRWSTVLGALGADHIVLENLSFLLPHLPLYLLIPFYYMGLDSGAAPYVLSVLAVSGLLWIWSRDIKEVEISNRRMVILGVLLLLHPGLLWAATSGGHIALSMVAFYLLYRASQHIITDHDLHSYIMLALVFVFYFFIDTTAIFIFVALIPLLMVIAPARTIMVSPMGLYLIVGTPFAFAVATWAYLNWVFEGDFLHFITSSDSLFLGGMLNTFDFPWLLNYGGQFVAPLLTVTGYMLIAYPVSVYLLLDTLNNNYRFRATFVLLLHPLIAIAIATSQNFLEHPFEILTLISAGLMAELTYVQMQTRREFLFLVVFMVISIIGGWWLFVETGTPQMKQWVQAFQGEVTEDPRTDGELQLGLWLNRNRYQTMMYERSGYRVVVARGDAKGLALSFSNKFKVSMRDRIPDIDQIAVPDPSTRLGARDWINIRHPNLYEHGLRGFRLVYDQLGWRVYRKKGV